MTTVHTGPDSYKTNNIKHINEYKQITLTHSQQHHIEGSSVHNQKVQIILYTSKSGFRNKTKTDTNISCIDQV